MFNVYAAYKNSDMTEGRGPMIMDRVFSKLNDANQYIDNKPGVMGRTSKWSTEKFGDWEVRVLSVVENEQVTEIEKQERIQKALSKLTDQEKADLGLEV